MSTVIRQMTIEEKRRNNLPQLQTTTILTPIYRGEEKNGDKMARG